MAPSERCTDAGEVSIWIEHHPLIQAEWQQGLKETFDLAVLGSYEVIRERAEYLGESTMKFGES